jgi:hypothetical protein
MTDRKARVTDIDASSTTTQQLREALLNSGLIDWVSLSDVDFRAAKLCRELPRPQRQEITLDTIRSLVSEGLFTQAISTPRMGDSPRSMSRSTKG